MQNAGVVPADRRQLARLPCRIAVSFASSAAGLLRLEEEGAFRFFGGEELRAMAMEVGFEEVEVVPGFGDPPQAVIMRCRRP